MSGFLDLVAPGSDLSPVGLLILVLGAALAGGVEWTQSSVAADWFSSP
ncbi:hypothetical protein [Corynebacterium variabile]